MKRVRLILLILGSLFGVSSCGETIHLLPNPPCKYGPRYTMPCENPVNADAANIKLKADLIKKFGIELGYKRDKLQELTDKTISAIGWRANLCHDWNACAIDDELYQKRKDELVKIEKEVYAIAKQAEELNKAKAGKADIPAELKRSIEELELSMSVLLRAIDRVGEAFRK